MNRRTKRLRLAAATGFCSAGSANFEYQFGMEARVGIGRISPSTSHSKSTAYGIADALNIRLLRFMSSLTPADFF